MGGRTGGRAGKIAPGGAINAAGFFEKGNIDLHNRPKVPNPEGGTSTVFSMSFSDGQHEILIPRVVGHKILSESEAIKHYYQTGEHLGKFDTPEHADMYARKLHEEQAHEYGLE